MGKYSLTAAGLPVLFAFKNLTLFGIRFLADLIPTLVALYVVPLAYKVALLRAFIAKQQTPTERAVADWSLVLNPSPR